MKTETEIWERQIVPQISSVAKRHGAEGNAEFKLVLNALCRLCFSLGHEHGYNEGYADAKAGRDRRRRASELHVNGGE